MNEVWTQGLIVSIVGLTVTFAALGLLIGLMALLTRVFPAKKADRTTAVPPTAPPALPQQDDAAIAAAIATALALAQQEQDQQLGHNLENGHSPWWYKDKARERRPR